MALKAKELQTAVSRTDQKSTLLKRIHTHHIHHFRLIQNNHKHLLLNLSRNQIQIRNHLILNLVRNLDLPNLNLPIRNHSLQSHLTHNHKLQTLQRKVNHSLNHNLRLHLKLSPSHSPSPSQNRRLNPSLNPSINLKLNQVNTKAKNLDLREQHLNKMKKAKVKDQEFLTNLLSRDQKDSQHALHRDLINKVSDTLKRSLSKMRKKERRKRKLLNLWVIMSMPLIPSNRMIAT